VKLQKAHLRIVLYLLAAAVLYNAWYFLRPAPKSGAAAAATQPLIAPASPPSGAAAVDPVSIPAPPDIVASRRPAALRDPFLFGDENRNVRVMRVVEAAEPSPTVQTILYSQGRKLAIVDGHVVGPGDAVGSYAVAEIEPRAVVFLTRTGERRRIALPQPQGVIR
jgi:hypothetical protein